MYLVYVCHSVALCGCGDSVKMICRMHLMIHTSTWNGGCRVLVNSEAIRPGKEKPKSKSDSQIKILFVFSVIMYLIS
jgi:hypothetical protein